MALLASATTELAENSVSLCQHLDTLCERLKASFPQQRPSPTNPEAVGHKFSLKSPESENLTVNEVPLWHMMRAYYPSLLGHSSSVTSWGFQCIFPTSSPTPTLEGTHLRGTVGLNHRGAMFLSGIQETGVMGVYSIRSGRLEDHWCSIINPKVEKESIELSEDSGIKLNIKQGHLLLSLHSAILTLDLSHSSSESPFSHL